MTNEIFEKLVDQYNLAAENLTREQLAEALRQAMPDFVRYVRADAQQVVYLPGREAERLSNLYHELIFAVERKFDGESRHETALRYIREAEQKISGPCSEG